MRKVRKYLVVCAVLIAVSVALLVAAPYFIDVNRYLPEITDVLSKKLNRTVTIDRLRLSLILGPTVVASGVTITDPHRPDHPLLSAREIRVRVGLLPLISGDATVRRVVLKKPEVMLVRYPDGSLNTDGLAMMEKEEAPSGPPVIHVFAGRSITIKRFLVRSVSIRGGVFAYLKEEPDSQFRPLVSLNGIDLDMDSIVIPTGTPSKTGGSLLEIGADIAARISDGSIGPVPFTRLSFSGSVKEGTATLASLTSGLFGGDLSGNGSAPLVEGRPDGTLTLKLSKANANELLNAFSGQKDALWGTLDLTGDYTFPLKNLEAGLAGKGNVSLRDGYVADFSLRDELAKAIKIPPEALPKELDTGEFSFIGGDYIVRSERIVSDHFTVDGKVFSAVGGGFVGFNKALDFSGTITLKEAAPISSLYSDALSLVGLSGTIDSFPFAVSGTLDHARFSIPLVRGVEGGIGNIFKSFGIDIGR
jgi:uncharacterized protein involved in outer membrane biogenesis